MKIKDLPKGTNLEGIKIRTDTGQEGYWKSQWQKGVWLTDVRPDTLGAQQVHPVFVSDLAEALEWEVLESENTIT